MSDTRPCSLCGTPRPLTPRWFAKTRKGFGYLCTSCRSIEHAIIYRRQKLAKRHELAAATIRPLADVEREAIETAVALAGPLEAAKLLGIGRMTVYRKLGAYAGMPPRAIRQPGTAVRTDFDVLRRELDELEARWKSLRAQRAGRRAAARALAGERLGRTLRGAL